MYSVVSRLVAIAICLVLQGCVATAVGAAVGATVAVAGAVVTAPFKIGGAIVDAASDDECEGDSDNDNSEEPCDD